MSIEEEATITDVLNSAFGIQERIVLPIIEKSMGVKKARAPKEKINPLFNQIYDQHIMKVELVFDDYYNNQIDKIEQNKRIIDIFKNEINITKIGPKVFKKEITKKKKNYRYKMVKKYHILKENYVAVKDIDSNRVSFEVKTHLEKKKLANRFVHSILPTNEVLDLNQENIN
jgi:hypothetical protein